MNPSEPGKPIVSQSQPYQTELAVAVRAARAGAAELMARRDDRTVHYKGPKDLVTDADLASQTAIRSILESEFPADAFVGEERGETEPPEAARRGDADAPRCWVVDPLDGTINYVHRLQSFAVSIALHAAGRMRVGVIYDPVTDQMFTATDGGRATCNGETIAPSGRTEMSQSLIACSFPAGVKGEDPEIRRFIRVLESCRSIRRLGSCALNLCYVAAGRLDAYWAPHVHTWDAAAGGLIARVAGVSMTTPEGNDIDDWNPRPCVSASPELHEELLRLLAINDPSAGG